VFTLFGRVESNFQIRMVEDLVRALSFFSLRTDGFSRVKDQGPRIKDQGSGGRFSSVH
jgi:hypothetical protein